MEATNLYEFIANQTGTAAFAALCLYLLNNARTEIMRREQENADYIKSINAQLFTTLGETIRAVSRLESEVRELRGDIGDAYGRDRPSQGRDTKSAQ